MGQVREWKALFTAICPGVPLPRTPCKPKSPTRKLRKLTSLDDDQNSSTPTARGRAASVQKRQLSTAPDRSPVSVPSPGQHRQFALQTIDILRGNILNYSDSNIVSEKETMISVVHALLPLIQRTQAPVPRTSTPQAQSSTTSAPVVGLEFPDITAEALQPVEEQPQLLSGTRNP